MTRCGHLFISLLFIAVLFSCNRVENEIIAARLAQWDELAEKQPRAIQDSLATLNPKKLSHANRARYGLLKTIADDKTYSPFTSDSMINQVVHYFGRHGKGGDHHIRSLVYQGIVRYRMGITDSTVFTPLKEAEQLYMKQKQPNLNTGYLLYYYLGDIHSANGNDKESGTYFDKTLQLAKQKGDSTHIFDAYLAFFWNEMVQEKYNSVANLLDSLDIYAGTKPDNIYYLLNAQSIYYKNNKETEKSIHSKKEQIDLIPQIRETIDAFRIYYSLSDAYLENNQLDSAMHYGLLAINHIEDSTYRLNYLLYENVADIAEQQQNLALALEYRKKAFDTYEKSIDDRLDTRILELEKRYNLSEAENKTLKARRNVRIWLAIALIVVLLLVLLGIYTRNQRTIGKLKEREAAEKASRLEAEKRTETEKALRLLAEKEQMQEQTTRQQKILGVSAQFLSEYAALQEKAREMINRIRTKDNKLGDDYEQMLKEGQQHFNELADRLFTEEELKKLFDIRSGLEVFSQTDRLFLIMLASNASNTQIAAMLNTSTNNLKTRKSYLKEKIEKNATEQNNFAQLLTLFNRKTSKS